MNAEILDLQTAQEKLPKRDPYGHKGNFGKVLLLCGSRGYTGAAWFAAMGALRSGTGLVYLGVPESIYAIEATKLNEPVIFPLPETDGKLGEKAIPKILTLLPRMQAVLIGCGLGQGEEVRLLTEQVLLNADCPVVLDADGINLMNLHRDILRRRKAPLILTPHDGEFLRIGGSLSQNRMKSAMELATDLNAVVLLKGHETCITDGKRSYLNKTGNSGMAKGGSGDLLAGLITGFLGQGMDCLTAAACGAFFHGAAGDLAAGELGEYGVLPSDLITFLPRLLKRDGME